MIQGLLLAAGNSTRFGGQKLLKRLPNGQSIAMTSALGLRHFVDRITVIVNPDHQAMINLFMGERISLVPCAQSKYGVGHSIACGVSATKDAEGWVIALADMPFIKSTTMAAVAKALKDGALIAAPVCGAKRGHPVGFSQKLYRELVQLKGDIGGQDLLRLHLSDMVEVPCQDPGIFIDIDTPEELEKYSRQCNH